MKSLLATMRQKKVLSGRIPDASTKAVDFIFWCLQLNSTKRIQAKDALRHDYFAMFRKPEKERDCHVVKIPINDNILLRAQDYRYWLFSDKAKQDHEHCSV